MGETTKFHIPSNDKVCLVSESLGNKIPPGDTADLTDCANSKNVMQVAVSILNDSTCKDTTKIKISRSFPKNNRI